MLFDSHTHLNDDLLFSKVDEVIKEAMTEDVSYFLCVGYDKTSSLRAIELSDIYLNVYAAIGFHPTEALKVTADDLEWLESMLSHKKVKAIGEIGLDYYWDSTYKDIQHEVFIKQLKLANKYHLPVSIHMRDATKDTFDLIKKYKDPGIVGVMHCFSGSVESAKEFIKLNMMISLAGPVTYKNAVDPKQVAKEIELCHLLIETDAPYLAPHPFRGKENVPKYVKLVAKEIARLKELSYEQVALITAENAKRVFHIK
jgi:TatD DNase family protein